MEIYLLIMCLCQRVGVTARDVLVSCCCCAGHGRRRRGTEAAVSFDGSAHLCGGLVLVTRVVVVVRRCNVVVDDVLDLGRQLLRIPAQVREVGGELLDAAGFFGELGLMILKGRIGDSTFSSSGFTFSSRFRL